MRSWNDPGLAACNVRRAKTVASAVPYVAGEPMLSEESRSQDPSGR